MCDKCDVPLLCMTGYCGQSTLFTLWDNVNRVITVLLVVVVVIVQIIVVVTVVAATNILYVKMIKLAGLSVPYQAIYDDNYFENCRLISWYVSWWHCCVAIHTEYFLDRKKLLRLSGMLFSYSSEYHSLFSVLGGKLDQTSTKISINTRTMTKLLLGQAWMLYYTECLLHL